MFFIVLGKYRKKPSKEVNAQVEKLFELSVKAGIKFINMYWTLGRYDFVSLAEAKDEKAIMKNALTYADFISTETLIAVPREEATKLVE